MLKRGLMKLEHRGVALIHAVGASYGVYALPVAHADVYSALSAQIRTPAVYHDIAAFAEAYALVGNKDGIFAVREKLRVKTGLVGENARLLLHTRLDVCTFLEYRPAVCFEHYRKLRPLFLKQKL